MSPLLLDDWRDATLGGLAGHIIAKPLHDSLVPLFMWINIQVDVDVRSNFMIVIEMVRREVHLCLEVYY